MPLRRDSLPRPGPVDPERQRLADADAGRAPWRRFGPYLSERQWGTVREDYSPEGTAWDYFPHDHARSRAYRWGEDGIGGLSDDQCRLCLAVGLWNGQDLILKERLFGLTGKEGNHAEDVKELYWYLDATPTHSYLRMLYKYPQRAFPYDALVTENRRRGKHDPEYELIDTGVFDDDRYFDVEIEYAKAGPEDVLWRVTATNRGPETATIDLLMQVWFRNVWSWGDLPNHDQKGPLIYHRDSAGLRVLHPDLGEWDVDFDAPDVHCIFCDNETNARRLFGEEVAEGYFKDGFHEWLVGGDRDAVNPDGVGTKAAGWARRTLPAGGSTVLRARLRPSRRQVAAPGATLAGGAPRESFQDADEVFATRRTEADAFYAGLQEGMDEDDARRVQRQALAGMIWTKQFYYIDVPRWLDGDPGQPTPPASRRHGRNADWRHLNNADILSMPDCWEYPWYAAWDSAFHCLPLALIDPEFAKEQLVLLCREWYMHPNGQLPAYEWAFGDVNPPVHAWATWRVFQIDRKQRGGEGDIPFLERVFHKLLLNFTWWVNRKDALGRNVFQGGFLGLDNIGVFDRSKPLPTGGFMHQADGTAWMAMYSLNLMRIALELALHNPVYEDIATKFFEHFLHIAEAITHLGPFGLWDEEDGFFYDELILDRPDVGHEEIPLRVRSMVGLIPMFAVEVLDPELLERVPAFRERLEWYLRYRPDLRALVSHWEVPGVGMRRLLSLLRGHRLKCLLRRMLDEGEFLSPYGVRALSKVHEAEPYRFEVDGQVHQVRYTPGESDTHLFGGNSNWRGPIWFPVNYLLIESLQKFHHYYGDDFQVESPVGSGRMATLNDVADDLARRLASIFLRDARGRRPVFGDHPKLQHDPHFRDHVLFYEYFHGDDGRGVGASHQTGWTGLVAKLLAPRQPPR
jgi:hypothetical protein